MVQAVCRLGQHLYKISNASAYYVFRLLFNLCCIHIFFSFSGTNTGSSVIRCLQEPDIVGISLLGKRFKVCSDNIDHFFCFLFLLFFLNALLHLLLSVYVAEYTGELNLLAEYLCILTI